MQHFPAFNENPNNKQELDLMKRWNYFAESEEDLTKESEIYMPNMILSKCNKNHTKRKLWVFVVGMLFFFSNKI